MTDEDRAYYRTRYEYAVRKAEESIDASTKAAHLVMAAAYRQRSASADDDADMTAERPIVVDADAINDR